MALPERLFYPLDKAVIKINQKLSLENHIDIEDLLYFCFCKKVELCVFYTEKMTSKYILPTNYRSDWYHNEKMLTLGQISINTVQDSGFKFLEELFVHDDFYGRSIKTKYGFIAADLFARDEVFKLENDKDSFNYKYPFINHFIDINNINTLLAIQFSICQMYPVQEIVISQFKLPRNSFFIADRIYNQISEKNPNSFLDSLFKDLDNIIEVDINSSYPVKLDIKDLLITQEEINLFLEGGNTNNKIALNTEYESAGRPENYYKRFCIDVGIATREKYPFSKVSTISEKLINYIKLLSKEQSNNIIPTKATIDNYLRQVGLKLPSIKSSETFELVIPERYKLFFK
ncbi:hypothetical protein J3U35_11040 [Gilliamella sp. B2717]|uniref:hypothetical protein n=1 Tax=Gilliamella sp. B2717 TaxID=2817996 RepID=UPI00226A3012|nr:hypothetical protein [Gilliamella sp. B2717]MCX8579977.1 hypothetical protein [Gilliamella sp. B2717]